MSRIPSLTPREVVAALEKCGFVVIRISGSHYQLFDEQTGRHTSVPFGRRDLPRGTVSAILHQAGLSRDEFLGLL
jgi:predicted RNA binding protein YcfA (HicA-like mRNA interferase family)